MAKYREIRGTLLERITSGAWAPGAAIPTEADLAGEFGVTRPTVSRALRDLVDGGLIERKRKAGSRVALRRSGDATLRIPIVREEIEARGGRYGYRLLARRETVPPAPVRALFGLLPRSRSLYLRALHLEDSRAHQLEDRWINLRVLPEASREDFSGRSANEFLVRQVPYTEAEHVLSAVAASKDDAAILDLAPGSPLLVVDRTTWSGSDALTCVRLAYPGSRARLVARSTI